MPSELMGSVPMDGREYYEPLEGYGQMTWSPMISESYPGMFWNPNTGRLETQAQIMGQLKWPKLGGIPYEYHPRRRRGFLGMEYPLVGGVSGEQWGYGAEGLSNQSNIVIWTVSAVGIGLCLLYMAREFFKGQKEAEIEGD